MALIQIFIDTAVAGGTGDGSSLANAYSTLGAAITASGRLVSSGDILEFNCTGGEDASSVNFTSAYTGTGLIRIRGDHTSGPKKDLTKYRLSNTAVTRPFKFVDCPNIDFQDFQYFALLVSSTTALFEGGLSGLGTASSLPNLTGDNCYFEVGTATQANEMYRINGASGDKSSNTPELNFTNCVFDGNYNDILNIRYADSFKTDFVNCTFPSGKRMLAYNTGAVSAADLKWTDCIFNSPVGHSAAKGTVTNCAFKVELTTDSSGITQVSSVALPNAFSTYFTDSANKDYTVIDAAPLSGAGVSGGLIGSSFPAVASLIVTLLSQAIDLSLWTAGSGGVVRGNDKPGNL